MNLFSVAPDRYLFTVEEARAYFADYMRRVDLLLEENGVAPAAWVEEIYEEELLVRQEVFLESGQEFHIYLCSDVPPDAPCFNIYYAGWEMDDLTNCEYIPETCPLLWKVIDLLSAGNMSYSQFESVCTAQRNVILQEMEEGGGYSVGGHSSGFTDIRKGLFSIGTMMTEVENQRFLEDSPSEKYYTTLWVNMFLY